ncbi:serine/threonine-protein kinase [Pseudofrankia inefficax]|uniref:non-specific serine/threonine protein kinase n=1 Tax=Pseudofrankia inefficax (strain DSM 45817 / CECT 9037 / DDB 130130 / EuI1c) TaxID=298654 RepID=E3J1E9_PSEI1|nr:serine/threonine-protein kinase [Pseudofrankia inefficax]ADP80470.1 serine/threonine protein kinase [Pseudofrankia inefficax]
MLAPLTDDDPRSIGPFRLGGRLGSGGMGTVYLGFGTDDQAVAVKVPSASLVDDARFRARFRREAVAVQSIDSGSVAAVVAADTEANPPWLATEFIQGATLLDAVAGRGPLAARLVVGFAAGLADGLVAIHAVGVVHRDLKPANVVLAWDGPKIIDFGVALTTRSLLGVDSGADSDVTVAQTQAGQRLGTFVWMAPEQLRGGTVGPAADVFAWGACVTYATTGHGPFRADGAFEIIARIQRDEPDLDGVPAELVDLVRATLAKDPDDRPTAAALVSALLHQNVQTPLESDRAVETALLPWVAQPPTPSPIDTALGEAPVPAQPDVDVPSGTLVLPPPVKALPAAKALPPAKALPAATPELPAVAPVDTGPRQLAARAASGGALPTPRAYGEGRGGGGSRRDDDSGDLPTMLPPGAYGEARGGGGSRRDDDSGELPTMLRSPLQRTQEGHAGVGARREDDDSGDLPTMLRSPLQPDHERPRAGGGSGGRPDEAAFADAAGWQGGPRPPVQVGPGRPSSAVKIVLALVTVLVVAAAVGLALVLAHSGGGGGSGVEVSSTSTGAPTDAVTATPSTPETVASTTDAAVPPPAATTAAPSRQATTKPSATPTQAPTSPPSQTPTHTTTTPPPTSTTPSVAPTSDHPSTPSATAAPPTGSAPTPTA